ncbi:hypothetical protein EUX98_g5819 [Antrodiella citrinella]|uniref:Uncharacterized protein n=1 Tax=Antrodiella citrinella TaxID=2447956 RepID=A0A4S4MQI2_9APHY|nr:hypothetical protein EUX98_g5819 [Antrodiella citrinella]
MERHWPDARAFCEWTIRAQADTLSQRLEVDTLLDVRVGAFSTQEHVMCFRWPPQPEKPPPETLDFVLQDPRPRKLRVDSILKSAAETGALRFKITDGHRHEPDTFFGVFVGRLEWTAAGSDEVSEACETDICLKLFDETMFPIPPKKPLAQYRPRAGEEFEPPNTTQRSPFLRRAFHSMKFANDMMRHELAVYERLQYLQGTLLPHAYGFHEFVLPGGRKIYGFFTKDARSLQVRYAHETTRSRYD